MSEIQDHETIRLELLKLAKAKEIDYTQVRIKKMGYTELEQVYHEYKVKQLDNLNETFADILIVKFDELMKTYNFVRPDSHLAQKLQNRKLFKNDLKTIVSYFTPLLPYLGLIEGSAVIVSEVVDNYTDSNKNDENTSYTTSQRDKRSSTPTESVPNDTDAES